MALPDWWDLRRWSDYTHVLGAPGDEQATVVNCREHPSGTGERHLMVDGVVNRLCPFTHDGTDANITHAIPGTCATCGGPLVHVPGERTYHPAATSDREDPCPALLPLDGLDPAFGCLSNDVPEDQFIIGRVTEPAADRCTGVEPDDWPVDSLLRARAELERWAMERGLLRSDQRLVVEVRALPLRRRPERVAADGVSPPNMDGTDLFGLLPKSALVIHHGEDGWT